MCLDPVVSCVMQRLDMSSLFNMKGGQHKFLAMKEYARLTALSALKTWVKCQMTFLAMLYVHEFVWLDCVLITWMRSRLCSSTITYWNNLFRSDNCIAQEIVTIWVRLQLIMTRGLLKYNVKSDPSHLRLKSAIGWIHCTYTMPKHGQKLYGEST